MIHQNTFIASDARVLGKVILGEGSSIWFGTIIRADLAPISIGRFSNIQDGCVLHVSDYSPVVIGDFVSVGHRAVVHGCTIDDLVLIGMGALILDGVQIGEGCIIGAGAVIPPDTVIPSRSLVLGIPGKVVRRITAAELETNRQRAQRYFSLWQSYYSGEG